MVTLTAKENMWLTQSGEIPDEERIYTDSVYLAVNDTAERWRDATNEEKEAWEQRIVTMQEEFDDSLLNGDEDEQE